MYKGKLIGIVLLGSSLLGCSVKAVNIKGQDYQVFNEESSLNTQYIKGFLGDYKGLVTGSAYDVSSVNYMWLANDVMFSKYTKLCVIDFENLSGVKGIKYGEHADEIDVSQAVTNAFFQDTQLRKLYKSIKKSKDGKDCDGLIVEGAVSGATKGMLAATVYTEVSLKEKNSQKQVGKYVISASHMHFNFAANRIPGIIADSMERYWKESPGFDPKELTAQNKSIISFRSKSSDELKSAEISNNLVPEKPPEQQPIMNKSEHIDVRETQIVPKTIAFTNIQETNNSELSSKVVAENKAKLRKTPSKNAGIIKTLKKGEEVKIVKQKEDWYLVELAAGETGWCHKSIFR